MNSNAASDAQPLVTVLIPILNEVRTIDDTLTSVVRQSYPNLDIVAIDGLSNDGTRDKLDTWVAADTRIRVIDNPRKAIPSALNAGLAAAYGQYLVRVDAHSSIPFDYVERLIAHLEATAYSGVGAKKTAIGSPPSGDSIAAALGSPFGVGGSVYHYATEPTETDHIPFGVYRTEVARELGGWDERLLANEDYEFDVRVRKSGGKLFLDPTVEIAWKCRSKILDLAKQYRRYGKGKADVAFLHRDEIRLRHAAPPVAVAGLVGSLFISPWLPWVPAVMFGGYALALGVMAVPISRSLPTRASRLKVPVILAAMQLPWGWGMWEGGARIVANGFKLPTLSDGEARFGSPSWSVDGSDPDG